MQNFHLLLRIVVKAPYYIVGLLLAMSPVACMMSVGTPGVAYPEKTLVLYVGIGKFLWFMVLWIAFAALHRLVLTNWPWPFKLIIRLTRGRANKS